MRFKLNINLFKPIFSIAQLVKILFVRFNVRNFNNFLTPAADDGLAIFFNRERFREESVSPVSSRRIRRTTTHAISVFRYLRPEMLLVPRNIQIYFQRQ